MSHKLVYVVYELTTGCNLRCSHCGTTCGQERENELTTSESKNLIKQIADMGAVILAFTGGEPLYRKDWFEIVSYAKEKDLEVSLLTNGIAVTDDDLNKLQQIGPVVVNVSIDGIGKTHDHMRRHDGAFVKSVDTLDRMRAKVPTCVVTTVTRDNFADLPKLLELMVQLDIRTWQIQLGVPMGRMSRDKVLDMDHIKKVADFIVDARRKVTSIEVVSADSIGYCYPGLRHEEEPWRGCLAGKILCSVTSNGFVTGCLSMPESTFEANIRDMSLRTIWEDEKRFSYNRDFHPEKLTGKCKMCDQKELCRAGCSSMRYAFGNTTEYPFCLKN